MISVSSMQPASEADLKCNRLLDELVLCFTNSRTDFMALSQLSMLRTHDKDSKVPSYSGVGVKCGRSLLGEGKEGVERASMENDWRTRCKLKKKEVKRKDVSISKIASQVRTKNMTKKITPLLANGLDVDDGNDAGVASEGTGKEAYHVPEPPLVTNSELVFNSQSDSEMSSTPPIVESPLTPTTACSMMRPTLEIFERKQEDLVSPRSSPRIRRMNSEEVTVTDISLCSDSTGGGCDLTPPLVVRDGDKVTGGHVQGGSRMEAATTNSDSESECTCGSGSSVDTD